MQCIKEGAPIGDKEVWMGPLQLYDVQGNGTARYSENKPSLRLVRGCTSVEACDLCGVASVGEERDNSESSGLEWNQMGTTPRLVPPRG